MGGFCDGMMMERITGFYRTHVTSQEVIELENDMPNELIEMLQKENNAKDKEMIEQQENERRFRIERKRFLSLSP